MLELHAGIHLETPVGSTTSFSTPPPPTSPPFAQYLGFRTWDKAVGTVVGGCLVPFQVVQGLRDVDLVGPD